MSARRSFNRLERRAARALGAERGPCVCQGPLVVGHHLPSDTPPSFPDRRCDRCGRERDVPLINITHTPPQANRRRPGGCRDRLVYTVVS
ncbi:MAG: hypothetical protein IT429_15250 [Gemmataceae bacterium]|nr:hypothetical protein [Gemmataceae bacterium]